ncbi:nucleotide exchange factor GrpE [Armatimonadetes bacterium Uphvl-Ar1]|nr:nucleotide exchange factor GrpE [Armatimonadetes bacterium Uphvl-Ar1]
MNEREDQVNPEEVELVGEKLVGTEEPVSEPHEGQDVVDERDELIAKLNAALEATKEEMLRQLAEAQNIQRRLRSQIEQDRKYAVESLVRDLVPVLDNFERSLNAAEGGASPEAVIDGIRAMQKSLVRVLEPVGLVRVSSVGEPFDPEKHEALAMVETEDVPPDTVTDEIEPGYVLADRLIRPARVRVSKAPEA